MPKYTPIFEALRRDLESGRFSGNRRLPSEAELSRRYGVSRPTAARAVRELQLIGLIVRRPGSGTYAAQPKADPISNSLTLGLLVPGLSRTEILDPICREINRHAQSLGHRVVGEADGQSEFSGDDALAACRELIEESVAGVLFAPIEMVPDRQIWNYRIATEFAERGIPMVLLDRDLDEFPARSHLDLIGIDNVAAGLELTEHLIAGARRQICFLARPHFPSTTDLRLLGCREAVRRHGITDAGLVVEIGDPTNQAFVQNLMERRKPDAIICSNDQTAALLIRTMGQLGVRIPDEIAVAGFDDVQYAMLLAPPLTTIRQPCSELGRSAVRILLERISEPNLAPRQVLHRHELVIRTSTRETKASAAEQ